MLPLLHGTVHVRRSSLRDVDVSCHGDVSHCHRQDKRGETHGSLEEVVLWCWNERRKERASVSGQDTGVSRPMLR